MMYIRTKDGRILDFDKLNEVSKLSIDMAEEPIREAETIEELCDEFVLHNDNTTKLWLCEPYDLINEYLREGINHRYTIYGAIWTSKGLIYVAKMDDKGDLKLI